MLKEMAEAYAKGKSGSVMSFKAVDLEALDKEIFTIDSLKRLESLHQVLILYLWLSYRFSVLFHPRETAIKLKNLCEARIQKCLNTIRFNRKRRRGERASSFMMESQAEEFAEEMVIGEEIGQDKGEPEAAPTISKVDLRKNYPQGQEQARSRLAEAA
jgi:ATP-dependent RNA helicase SUPV3L1/SUV3